MIRIIIIIASVMFSTGFTGCAYHSKSVWVAPSHEAIFKKEFNLTILIADYQKIVDIIGLWAEQNSFQIDDSCYPGFRPRFGANSVGTVTFCKESTSIHVALVPSQNATEISLLDTQGSEYISSIDKELKQRLRSEFGSDSIYKI